MLLKDLFLLLFIRFLLNTFEYTYRDLFCLTAVKVVHISCYFALLKHSQQLYYAIFFMT